MEKFIYSLCIYLNVISFLSASNLEHDGWVNIRLEHSLTSLEKPVFTERGNISIQSLRLGQAIVQQHPLSPEERTQLKDLAAQNDYYQLKSTAVSSDGSENTFLSTIKACMLAESELDDRLSVSLDYSGRVIGVTLVIASKSTCEGVVVPLSKLKEFTTSVYIRHTETGPIPDTATYIQRLEREREAKERGEVPDNRSFWSKYWFYILLFGAVVVISSMSNPEAGTNGGAGR